MIALLLPGLLVTARSTPACSGVLAALIPATLLTPAVATVLGLNRPALWSLAGLLLFVALSLSPDPAPPAGDRRRDHHPLSEQREGEEGPGHAAADPREGRQDRRLLLVGADQPRSSAASRTRDTTARRQCSRQA